jgi:hypothetical protein
MSKDVIVKYLPSTTTQDEVRAIREEFNKTHNPKEVTLIIMVSGKNKILNCLQDLINVD